MLIKLLILSAVLLFISLAGLGIKILLKSHGRFPETHISRNKEMQKRGITCASDIESGCMPSEDFPGCSACERVRL